MKFNNKSLRNAVQEWLKNSEKTESKYGHISNWDTSNVTDMSHMFRNGISFNQPINFNTKNVTDMAYMFYNCSSFD